MCETEGKCNESVSNEFTVMRERDLLRDRVTVVSVSLFCIFCVIVWPVKYRNVTLS